MEDNRIQELLIELQQSREEQRHNEAIIIQTITTVATVLGILSGVSHLSTGNAFNTPLLNQSYTATVPGIKRILYLVFSDLTLSRLFFYISCLAFCATFSYISICGVKATMLYFYIQNIQDRLQTLIHDQKDDEGRGQFVHFDDYYSPISTLNIKHLSSSYSCWHYFTVLFTVICAIGCSLGFVLLQFLSIGTHLWHDSFCFLVTIITMVITLFMYLRTTINSRMIAQFSMDTAHQNMRARLQGFPLKQYPASPEYVRQLRYLLFPRLNECYKALIVFLGYVSSCYYFNQPFRYTEILLLLFLFEYLMYGVRYQINDIRGAEIDLVFRNNRLFSAETKNKENVIKKSLIVATIKFCSALILTFIFAWEDRWTLLGSYLSLLLITIMYEAAKEYSSNRSGSTCCYVLYDYFVYLAVGAGYPLRFLVGFLVSRKIYSINDLKLHFVCFLLSIFMLGIFTSLLSWRRRLISLGEEKAFEYCEAQKHFARIKTLHLKGKSHTVFLPWNIFYWLSLLLNLIAIIASDKANDHTACMICCISGLSILNSWISKKSNKHIIPVICLVVLCLLFLCSPPLIKIYIGELMVIIISYTYMRSEYGNEVPLNSFIKSIRKSILSALIGKSNSYWTHF